MSGYDGGTGAARQHALRRAGLPCEIGTVLAHHALTEAGIRDRVEIWADGGLRSAADCVKLICMGANRLGFGTASMVAIGCTICRGCQLDTCHVGIATQIDEHEAAERGLKRFVPRIYDPAVEALVKYFTEMGEALRDLAGRMGVSEVQELVGQADRLVQVSHHDRLDLSSLLTPVGERVITSPAGTPRFFRAFNPPPPHRAPEVAAERLAAGVALAVEEETTPTAADRNLGTDLAGLIARAATGVNDTLPNGSSGLPATGGNGTSNGGGDAAGNGQANGHGNGHLPTLVDLAFTKGAAVGSGLAAFTLDGVRVRVFGGAQDGVGKCALGGDIQVLKARNDLGDWVGGHVGKSFAYGAQRGLFLIQGNADARAGIRLSGADLVLGGEPAQPLNDRLGTLAARSNCKGFAFEYMTGGRVVVLGDPGPVAVQRHDRRRRLRAPERRLGPRRGRGAAPAVEGRQGQPDGARRAGRRRGGRAAGRLSGGPHRVRPGRGGRAPPAAHRRAVGALPGDHPGDPAGRPQHLHGVAARPGRSPRSVMNLTFGTRHRRYRGGRYPFGVGSPDADGGDRDGETAGHGAAPASSSCAT